MEKATIRLPADLKKELQKEAERKGYTLHDLMMFILWKWILYTAQG